MEYVGGVLLLAILALLIVALFGGKISISLKGINLDSAGFVGHLREAASTKRVTTQTNGNREQQTMNRGKQFVRQLSHLPAAVVLWADDHPINNLYERCALSQLGIHCEYYTSNEEAISAYDALHPDVVVSDMGRDHGAGDGFGLLEMVRSRSSEIPFMFYTIAVGEQERARARTCGATAVLDRPDELIEEILQRIRDRE